MTRSVRQHIASLLRASRRRRRYLAVFALMAVAVSLGVAGLLSRNGIAMTHEETVLDCPVPGGEHTHSDACYDEEGTLTCGLDEHTHGPGCYVTITVADDEPEEEPAAPEEAEAPGAAEPAQEAEPEEAPAGEEAPEAEKNDAEKDAADEAKPATVRSLTYEDEGIKVTAQVRGGEAAPDGSVLKVAQITPATEGYNYSAYMEALQEQSDADVSAENTLLFDVAIMDGGVEWEPTDGGKVELSLVFKDNQLTDQIGVVNAETVTVTHLPIAPEVMEQYDSTREATNISSADITPEPVDASVSGDAARLSFEVEGLSTIAITNAGSTVNVSVSLSGAPDVNSMSLKNKNVYAYLVPKNGGSWIYGAKLNFNADGSATCTISGVPDSGVQDYNKEFELVLAYKTNDQTMPTGRTGSSELSVDVVRKVENGGYIYGFTYQEPTSYTQDGNTYSVSSVLKLPEISNGNFSLKSLMDRAINYGITANEVYYNVGAYTNFATKTLNVANANSGGGTIYSHRADNVDVVPNIIANINYDNLKLTSADKNSNYYVTDKDKDKVNSTNITDTIVRNQNEIEDRVEIMLSNTLKQCEELAHMNMATLPSTTSVDTTAYPANATIILDATAISKEPNGFTITKRPGQTIIFNIGGENVAPPDNTKVVLINDNGQQIDIDGNLSTKVYKAGDEMRDAAAAEGNVWNKIIWNFPDSTSVTAGNDVGGIFLVPKGDFNANVKGGGWVVARGKVSVTNEWYGFPGDDEPFKQKTIRKTFVGVEEGDINEAYALQIWTHKNASTHTTTNERLITTLVLKPAGDDTLARDDTGAIAQTGYITKGIDTDGNVYYEWTTPPLSVGNEHMLTELNATTKGGVDPVSVEFTGPYSYWSEADQNYLWISRTFTYTSADELAGVFNVSNHNEDYRKYVYVENVYTEKTTSDLFVLKTVTGHEPTPQPAYEFVVSLLDADGKVPTDAASYAYVITNMATGNADASGNLAFSAADGSYKATFSLTASQRIEIKDLPKGWSFTVAEKTDGLVDCVTTYKVGQTVEDGASVSGKLDRNQTVEVVNAYPVTEKDVLVTKTITDPTGVAFDSLASQGFAVHVDNKADASDTYELKLDDADVNRVATTGGYRYEWTIKGVPVGNEYLVTEINAELTGYTRSSSVSVNGETPHAISGAESITVSDSTSQQTVAFVNSYSKIPDSTTNLQAQKFFLDGEGQSLALAENQFAFKAEEWDVEARKVKAEGITMDAGNAASGLVPFETMSLDPDTTTYFMMSETAGSDDTVEYSGERYIAKVVVPKAQQTIPLEWSSLHKEGTYDGAPVQITIPIPEPDTVNPFASSYPENNGYRYNLNDGTGNRYSGNAGSITTKYTPGNNSGTYTYNIIREKAASQYNSWTEDCIIGSITIEVSTYEYDFGSYVGNLVRATSVTVQYANEVSSDPTITYYKLNADGSFDEKSPVTIPTFTNRLKRAAEQPLKVVKVGYDTTTPGTTYPLAGATFTLYVADDNWTKGSAVDGFSNVTSAEGTGLVFQTTLPEGNYLLEEVGTPAGYYGLSAPIKIIVTSTGITFTSDMTGNHDSRYEWSTPAADGDPYVLTVKNPTGVELPHTGGSGNAVFTITGSAVIAGALAYALASRRRREGRSVM